MSTGEIIDVVNEDGEVVDTISREQAEQDNHLTENVLVFIFNSLGKVWVQLRPQNKNHFPGRWDISACGGIISGEMPQQAADRETLEETKLKLKLRHVETFLNVFPGDHGEERKRLSYLFIGTSDETPQPSEEADEFKLWEPTELKADVIQNPNSYIPSFIVELDKAVAGYTQFEQI